VQHRYQKTKRNVVTVVLIRKRLPLYSDVSEKDIGVIEAHPLEKEKGRQGLLRTNPPGKPAAFILRHIYPSQIIEPGTV
jgi:hypothetical protein